MGKYLAPLGGDRFAVPADVGTVDFAGSSTSGFDELTWGFGSSARTYRRVTGPT